MTPTQIFSCKFCELSKNTLWRIYECMAGSETPVRLFLLNISISCFWQFQVSSLQLEAKMIICEFCNNFKNIFWPNTSGSLLLVFICEFWEVFQITYFIEHLCETRVVGTLGVGRKRRFMNNYPSDCKLLLLQVKEKWSFSFVINVK